MNAVNLIPGDYRKRQVGVSASPLTLSVIGGLVVVLVAAVLYVLAVNDVRARKSELARVTANATSWQAAANSYASYVTAAQQQKQQLTDVEQLITGRFPWSLLLSQIGGVLPANAALTSLQATAPSADAAGATGATSTSTGAPTSSSPTTQAVAITGCAASESAVAATMVALGRVHGVGSVSLASTSNSGATASGPASSASGSNAGSSSGGGCGFPVNFTLSLILASPADSSASSAGSPSTPAATPTASTTDTPATGSAQ